VNRLRNKLVLIFLAATLAPLAATVWITTRLLAASLDFSTLKDLETLSRSLERTGREFYQHKQENLKKDVEAGKLAPEKFSSADAAAWPEEVRAFGQSGQEELFAKEGPEEDRLDYLVRRGDDVWRYSVSLGEVNLKRLRGEIHDAMVLVEFVKEHDLRRGVPLIYIIAAACFWVLSLVLLIYLAHRTSRPIQQLTAGLSELAAGDLKVRVPVDADDEVGRAMDAFNDMACKLEESTERLVYLGQLASWQMLARKTAHELKNSLTPIRLTVEEMLARSGEGDRAFMEQATQIVVDEIETLERRVRAFSQFATEPPLAPAPVDVNQLLEERVTFLKNAHPEVAYECRLAGDVPKVVADQDMLKGILTNLLENAAEAAGEGGRILGTTSAGGGRVSIEVHDSGPGLSEQARASLFQPTISFKKRGMGLGLSIARKSAMLSGGDIVVVKGELGGAGFRVLLPVETNGIQTRPDRG
jgi:two-component system, NtrC family, nitrogen regulation sensor histidine kinase NtrY